MISTLVSLPSGPSGGASCWMWGSLSSVNRSAGVTSEVPAGVVTVTSIAPSYPAGDQALILVSERTSKLAAGTPANATAVAPVKPEPVMVTRASASGSANLGDTPLTEGELPSTNGLASRRTARCAPKALLAQA